jgi:hypothetical protein
MAESNGQVDDLEQRSKAAHEEIAELQRQMDQMRGEMREKLLAEWPSPWKNDQIVNTKVTGRLAENKEYKALILKIREAEAVAEKLDTELAAQKGGSK